MRASHHDIASQEHAIMNNTLSRTALTLALAVAFGTLAVGPTQALAQIAGASTTVGVSVVESTEVAAGWSVKKTLLGKAIYNDAGQKVGKVEDLIISPEKNVSYLIVGAGGFIGIGRHDVAVPVAQVKDEGGRLVMAGATKDALKALPAFDYANDSAQRDRFVAKADQDIAKGKARLADIETATKTAAADAKVKLDKQGVALKADIASAETKLGELKSATVKRWHEFEGGVNAATARVRKASDVLVNG
jgi:sporulation protein YlmC with PRC-barrel domain